MNINNFLVLNGFVRRSQCSKFYHATIGEYSYLFIHQTHRSFEIQKASSTDFKRFQWYDKHCVRSEQFISALTKHNELAELYGYIINRERREIIDNLLNSL